MEKLLKFLKNKWFLLGISFLSFIYPVILGQLVIRTFDSYLETENFSAMMIFYVFINFLFGLLMFFTRKQIPTIICALIIPLESFALLLVGFGQWYIIIPPVVVSAIIFLSCGIAEACKTVMGTLLLIMFVAGTLAYSIMSSYFGISIRFVATDVFTDQDQDLDYSTRSLDYLLSEDGKYRLVRYVEYLDEDVKTSYYVEEAFKDTEYPFVIFRRTFGSRRILVTAYERDVNPHWRDNETLIIDGETFKMEEVFNPAPVEEETTGTETEKVTDITASESENTEVPENTDEAA